MQVFGPGDVLQAPADGATVDCPVSWTALRPSAVVVLDERFTFASGGGFDLSSGSGALGAAPVPSDASSSLGAGSAPTASVEPPAVLAAPPTLWVPNPHRGSTMRHWAPVRRRAPPTPRTGRTPRRRRR